MLDQQVTVPAGATRASASYWVRVTTAEKGATRPYDNLSLQVVGQDGTVLTTLGTVSNLDADYTRKTYDLSTYKGKTVRLRWVAKEDFVYATTFVLDDTALDVT